MVFMNGYIEYAEALVMSLSKHYGKPHCTVIIFVLHL